MQVQKRDGGFEAYNVEKIHKVLEWAITDISNVSWSDIEMNAKLSLNDGVNTKEIHQILIKSANDLTAPSRPNYQYVASRLLNMSLRKDLWERYDSPPSLSVHFKNNIENGTYDAPIYDKWTQDQLVEIEQCVDHDRDYLFTYAGLQQLIDKYLIKNRLTNQMYETPQFAYVAIAMALFNTVDEVIKAYECFSTFKINLPTPIMAGVRTKIKQFASCVLVDVNDDLNSIFSSIHAVGKYTARRAGIGLNIGRIRPINSSIRGGEVIHTGLIPYLKIFESTVKATSQNGIRGGSATVHVPFFHYEIEDIMCLKNNAGTDDNRVRKLDYSVQFCKLFYERLIKNEDITLFSPYEAEGLYEVFGNNEEFNKLYEKYEKSRTLKFKKKINARKLAEIFTKERLETGRIYVMNIDNANEHGSWNIPVHMSNLCLTGDTKIDSIVDGKKMIVSLEELNDLFNANKDILVLSKDINSNILSYNKVLNSAMTMENAEIMEIENTESGFKIRCTPNHQIFTKNRGYVEAKDLKEMDVLDILP